MLNQTQQPRIDEDSFFRGQDEFSTTIERTACFLPPQEHDSGNVVYHGSNESNCSNKGTPVQAQR